MNEDVEAHYYSGGCCGGLEKCNKAERVNNRPEYLILNKKNYLLW